jgi:hypothetical protein
MVALARRDSTHVLPQVSIWIWSRCVDPPCRMAWGRWASYLRMWAVEDKRYEIVACGGRPCPTETIIELPHIPYLCHAMPIRLGRTLRRAACARGTLAMAVTRITRTWSSENITATVPAVLHKYTVEDRPIGTVITTFLFLFLRTVKWYYTCSDRSIRS